MKKIVALWTACSFLIFMNAIVSPAFAQMEEIEAEASARELAAKAGGEYMKGSTVPEVQGTEVALPVIDETSGEVLGHIVADREKLIATLNDAGLNKVADALIASEAGTVAGSEVQTGFSTGTITLIGIGIAAVIGAALALGGGGGGGGGSSPATSVHSP